MALGFLPRVLIAGNMRHRCLSRSTLYCTMLRASGVSRSRPHQDRHPDDRDRIFNEMSLTSEMNLTSETTKLDLPEVVIRPRSGWIAVDWKELLHFRELLFFLGLARRQDPLQANGAGRGLGRVAAPVHDGHLHRHLRQAGRHAVGGSPMPRSSSPAWCLGCSSPMAWVRPARA